MSKPTWITLSKSQGSMNDEINVIAAAYTGRTQRSGIITGTADNGASDTSTVEQNGKTEFITITETTKTITATGGTVDFTGTSNCADLKSVIGITGSIKQVTLSLEVNGESTLWDGQTITFIPDDPGADAEFDFTLHVKIPENQSVSSKTLIFNLTNANGDVSSAQLKVTQSAGSKSYATPVISSFTYGSSNIPASGGSLTPTLSYSQTWGWNGNTTNGGTLSGTLADPIDGTVFLFDGADDESTGEVSASSKGSTVSSITTVATVTAKVTVNELSSNVTAAQTVKQAANSITYGEVTWNPDITPQVDVIPASGGTSSAVEWVGDNAVSIPPDTPIASQKITYTSGYTGTVTTSDVVFVASPALNKITISYSEAVTAPSKGTSISGVTQVGQITITATGNGGKSATRTLNVTQAANSAKYGNVTINEDTPISLSSEGQTYQIDADARQTVTYTSGASRTQASSENPVVIALTYKVKTASTGFSLNTDLGEVTVTKNPSTSTRGEFVVTITATGEGSKTAIKDITFNQQSSESTLELTPTVLTFEATGGTKTLTITSNDTWTLS